MKTLFILRHAESNLQHGNLTDHDRPLNERGKQDAPRMGQLVKREQLVPDLIISSTATRARDTAITVAKEADYQGEIRFEARLYDENAESYLAVLTDLGTEPSRVMLVGHNPSVEQLLHALTGQFERLATAALAHVELPLANWRDLEPRRDATLVCVWQPRDVFDD